MAGEPERKLDFDVTPSEDELQLKQREEEEKAEEEWRSSRSFGSLKSVEPEERPEEPPPPASSGEAKEEPPAEDKPKKKKVRFKEPTPASTVPAVTAAATQPQPPTQPEPTPDKPKQSDSTLSDEDWNFVEKLPPEAKESVRFWSEAEEADQKYQGYAKKQVEYIRQHQSKVQQLREESPDVPIEENPKYVAWVKQNKPSAPRVEIKRLEKEIVINEAKKRLMQEQGRDLDELRQWKNKQEIEKTHLPVVMEKSVSFSKSLVDEVGKIPEAAEAMQLFKAKIDELKDPVKAGEVMAEEYPEEAAIIARNHRYTKTMADEFLRLRTGIAQPNVRYDNAGNPIGDPLHHQIADRVIAQEQAMLKPEMQAKRVRGGKQFATRQQLLSLPPEQRDNYWTFSDDEVLSFFSAEALARTKKELVDNKKRIELLIQKYGKDKKTVSRDDQSAVSSSTLTASTNKPRHKGTDSPSSSQRAEQTDSSPRKSRLINWDF